MKKIVTIMALLSLAVLSMSQARAADNTNDNNTLTNAAVSNALPVASGVTITDSDTSLSLTENTTTPVEVKATVTDNNGCEDIDSVGVKFFRTNLALGADLEPTAYATNGGLVRVTVSSASTLPTGSLVEIAGSSTTSYNGQWTVTYINATTIDLQSSTYVDDAATKGTLKLNSGAAVTPDDANNIYTATTTLDAGTCTTGGADLSATYTASISVQYYADPTDAGSANAATNWIAVVTPVDHTAPGTAAWHTTEMGTTQALSVTASITYGALALGANTGITNQPTTVTNTGNVVIDTELKSSDHEAAMACTAGEIPVANEKFGLSDVTYGSLTSVLAGSASHVDGATGITQRTDGVSSDIIYWGLGMPADGVSGTCSGSIVFTAVAPL